MIMKQRGKYLMGINLEGWVYVFRAFWHCSRRVIHGCAIRLDLVLSVGRIKYEFIH